jgi:hypothetical protein
MGWHSRKRKGSGCGSEVITSQNLEGRLYGWEEGRKGTVAKDDIVAFLLIVPRNIQKTMC